MNGQERRKFEDYLKIMGFTQDPHKPLVWVLSGRIGNYVFESDYMYDDLWECRDDLSVIVGKSITRALDEFAAGPGEEVDTHGVQ